MNVWGIADLHLSLARPEGRERYAGRWRDHAARIQQNWRNAVAPEDLVLIPGDISMARNHRDLQPDLAWLERLPGRKVLAPGNHDGWWNGSDRIRPLLRASMQALEGEAIEIDGLIIAGCRGASPPKEPEATPQDPAVQDELDSLDRALAAAAQLRSTPDQPLYVLWHYPPFDTYNRPGPCVSRLEAAKVTVCLYGHLHIQGQWSRTVQGAVRGVRYYCVAADAIGFRPLRISGGPSLGPSV